MRRSSGTNAIPLCATENGLWLVMSLPLNRIVPVLAGTSPMIVLQVVERPEPLRPSSATTSPCSTPQRDVLQHVRLVVVGVDAVELEQHQTSSPK